MSTNTTERENPLLQIDTSFRTYFERLYKKLSEPYS